MSDCKKSMAILNKDSVNFSITLNNYDKTDKHKTNSNS